MHQQKKRREHFIIAKDTFEQKFEKFCYFQCTTRTLHPEAVCAGVGHPTRVAADPPADKVFV